MHSTRSLITSGFPCRPLHSECEDGHVRAVYKNWEDPPMSSFSLVGYEESVRCYLPRIYCFSCEVGNCAPGQCKVWWRGSHFGLIEVAYYSSARADHRLLASSKARR